MKKREHRSQSQFESLNLETFGRIRRRSSLRQSSEITHEIIDHYSNDQLLNDIHRIEKEQKYLQLENILFSRYLKRVENTKILNSFDDFDEENGMILPSRYTENNSMSILPIITRLSSIRRSSIQLSNASLLWNKLSINWSKQVSNRYLSRIEQDKLSIAIYELEQTQLDWHRMKNNARINLDRLDDNFQAIESDEKIQEILINDFQKNIDQLRRDIRQEKKFHSNYLSPIELFIQRINKQLHVRIGSIGLLRIDTTRTRYRIELIENTMQILDDLRDQLDEIDLNFVRTRKIDYLDNYQKLDRKYKIETSTQYPLIRRLHQWKEILNKQEQNIHHNKYRYNLLQNSSIKLQEEIVLLEIENNRIEKENHLIENRIADVKKVPTITDYAYVMHQIKKLQHDIHIWTQRVNISQVRFVILIDEKKKNVSFF